MPCQSNGTRRHDEGFRMNAPSTPPVHILLVEDEAVVAMAMEDTLVCAGFRVTVTHNGRDALEADAKDRADLLLTDLRMPIMDGKVLIQRLRGGRPDLPVVVVTGTPPEDGVASIQRGDPGRMRLLVKPISMADLVVAVQWVIEPA
ncbi:response regulator [Azospirillum brasilense]|nr:response regulator [Azospirillum brasilense]NUB31526.1 response regulator [Azospirillum brasilense]